MSEYAERRAWFAVGRFSPRIAKLSVMLRDSNGPRGGVDKHCRLSARLHPWGAVRVNELDADPYAAIDRGMERLARAVAREIARRRGPRALSARIGVSWRA